MPGHLQARYDRLKVSPGLPWPPLVERSLSLASHSCDTRPRPHLGAEPVPYLGAEPVFHIWVLSQFHIWVLSQVPLPKMTAVFRLAASGERQKAAECTTSSRSVRRRQSARRPVEGGRVPDVRDEVEACEGGQVVRDGADSERWSRRVRWCKTMVDGGHLVHRGACKCSPRRATTPHRWRWWASRPPRRMQVLTTARCHSHSRPPPPKASAKMGARYGARYGARARGARSRNATRA